MRVDKGKPGNVFLNAVHRIDRAVSGIVLFARTSKALSRLNEDIRKRNCRKCYHALVEGRPPHSSGELVHWLAHDHHRAVICSEGDPGAQRSMMSYRIIDLEGRPLCRPRTGRSPSLQRSDLTLLEIDLETGLPREESKSFSWFYAICFVVLVVILVYASVIFYS